MTQNSTNETFHRQTTQVEQARPVEANSVEFLSGLAPPDLPTNPKRIWVDQISEMVKFTINGVDIHTLADSSQISGLPTYLYKYTRGNGVSNDVPAILAAISDAQAGGGVLYISKPLVRYTISSNLTIPNNIRVVIDGCAVNQTGTLTFNDGAVLEGRNGGKITNHATIFLSRNIVDGVTFDGELASRSITVSGATEIKNCSFLNMKTNIPDTATNVIFIDQSSNGAAVRNCKFDNIRPYNENGIIGDEAGAARAVRIVGNNAIVEDCFFINMVGIEDGDYIHAQPNSTITDTSFPYSELSGAQQNQRYDSIYAIIRNNIFYQSCKSSVKVQASNVVVENNTIYSNYTDTTKTFNAAIRFSDCQDNVCRGNTVFSTGTQNSRYVHASYCKRMEISNNTIDMQIPLTFTPTDIVGAIEIFYCEKVSASRNTLNLNNMLCAFIFYNNRSCSIAGNDVTILSGSVTGFLFVRGFAAVLIQSTNNVIHRNTLISDGLSNSISIENVSDLSIKGNDFSKAKFSFNLTAVTNCVIEENVMQGIAVGNDVVNLFSGSDNITLINNTMTTAFRSFVRLNTPVNATVKVYRNIFIVINGGSTQIFNAFSNSSQDFAKLSYITGSPQVAFHDFGATSDRPAYTKSISYSFFDTTLSKLITWNGTVWKDGAGTTV